MENVNEDDIKKMLSKLYEELICIKKIMVHKGTSAENYIDIETICQRFKISKKTLRRYRTSGMIPFYKISGKVYFLESEVKEALRKHYYGGKDSKSNTA